MINPHSTPADWYQDYLSLMAHLRDPDYAHAVCFTCAIAQAQSAKREIDRIAKYWEEQGGESARQEQLRMLREQTRRSSEKQDRMREAEWRLYNEAGGADNRTCEVMNYFNCPYGEEYDDLIENGSAVSEVWEHIRWYDTHWNRSHTYSPSASEMKWYHYDEPSILDVTDFEDITKAAEDGRLDRIAEEHERYKKEFKVESWNS
jgi:hypothetical protein